MARVFGNAETNPRLVIEQEEFLAWLKSVATKVGYPDRSLNGVQIKFGDKVVYEAPDQIVLMVSTN